MNRAIKTCVLNLCAALALAAAPRGDGDLSKLKGEIKIDGSSTVYPLSEAITEDFSKQARGVRATVGVSGTGGGFKRFCKGEIDACNASRPITKAEREACEKAGIEFIELPIAFDGLCIAVHPKNDWVKSLTVEQIRRIYGAKESARRWKDLDPSWPDRTIKVYSPGTDSGTFDYFREVTVGKDGTIRPDMSVSEDDNVLVKGVEGDIDAIGCFGFAYYKENSALLRAIAIDGGKGPVAPSDATILDGTYTPFSRPLFLYVSKKSAERAEVAGFVGFAIEHAAELAAEVGYTPLPASTGSTVARNWSARKTGTQFLDPAGERVKGRLAEIYH
jgi:phosphate transport system substrate-binding protein